MQNGQCIISKTSDPHRLLLNLSDKISLKIIKLSALTSNEKFELSNASHSVSDIEVCFAYIIKNMSMEYIYIYIYIYIYTYIYIHIYVNIEQKTELHLELKQGIIQNF